MYVLTRLFQKSEFQGIRRKYTVQSFKGLDKLSDVFKVLALFEGFHIIGVLHFAHTELLWFGIILRTSIIDMTF